VVHTFVFRPIVTRKVFRVVGVAAAAVVVVVTDGAAAGWPTTTATITTTTNTGSLVHRTQTSAKVKEVPEAATTSPTVVKYLSQSICENNFML